MTDDTYKLIQAEEIESIRKEIRSLPKDVRNLIEEGEAIIDEHLSDVGRNKRGPNLEIYNLNVFDLRRNLPAEVMKYLAMLYTAAGFHHVTFGCDRFSSSSRKAIRQVTYPNMISMKATR